MITAPRVATMRQTTVLVIAFGAVLSALVLWAMHDALVDDAYITLSYASDLAFHGQWGIIPGLPSNTATSPLDVMLLGALTEVTRSPMVGLWVLTVLNGMLLAAGLVHLGSQWRVGVLLAWVGVPLIVLNPLLASSLGLETTLVVTWMVWLIAVAASGRPRGFGWLAGVGVVLRPDVVVVAIVIWLFHPALRRPAAVSATWSTTWRALVVALPWPLFSWFYFGSAIPDTLVIKEAQHWNTTFVTGLWTRYQALYPAAVDSVLLVAVLGLAALAALPRLTRTLEPSARRPVMLSVAGPAVAGLVYFLAYWRLHVPPYFWYYGVPLATLTLPLAFAISVVASRARTPIRMGGSRGLAAAMTAVALAPVLAVWSHELAAHAPLHTAPVHANWASPSAYQRIGKAIARRVPPNATVLSAGEFGTMLYYCDCRLLDQFDDRNILLPDIERARESSWLMHLNYLWFDSSDYPPVPLQYHMIYENDHTTAKGEWNVWSSTRGDGHFALFPDVNPNHEATGLAG